ncbi:MAG: GNAT family N-acetyltransferase [Sphingobium sp.]|nr:MAG: GNAT family N-acetyltransferase [Sphingobium sp.]
MTPLLIRPTVVADHAAIWAILEPLIRDGEVFALPRDMSREEVLAYWTAGDRVPFVACRDGTIAGLYYLRPNQMGGGAHVANAGYATAREASGRGVARAMCAHSMDEARRRGFRAMQFNFVVSTNARAVMLWTDMGFTTVGRLPEAFHHPGQGYVDALVMARPL